VSYKQVARGNLSELRISFCAIPPLNMCDKSKTQSGNRLGFVLQTLLLQTKLKPVSGRLESLTDIKKKTFLKKSQT
ncbi:hypothetical protein, partial [Hominimerdicola sp. 21CYCFAH17_S]